jgi:hypothetical protein
MTGLQFLDELRLVQLICVALIRNDINNLVIWTLIGSLAEYFFTTRNQAESGSVEHSNYLMLEIEHSSQENCSHSARL